MTIDQAKHIIEANYSMQEGTLSLLMYDDCEFSAMDRLDLSLIYEHLKNKYSLDLTNSFSLNAGFLNDFQVLFGQSSQNKFYLYHDGMIAIFDIENRTGTLADHWHPDDTQEAMQMVIDFMEGTCEFDWSPIEQE